MVKCIAIFLAVLALHAVMANPTSTQEQQQNQQQLQQRRLQQQIQEILNQIQSASDNAASSIQAAQIQSQQDRRLLTSQANEYVHSLQNLVYNLQRATHNNQGWLNQQQPQDQKQEQQLLQVLQLQALQLQQSLRRLGEIAYSVQLAISAEPLLLRAQLQTNVLNAAREAQSLAQIAQQRLEGEQSQVQQRQQSQVNLNNYAISQALGSLLTAIQRLQIQSQIQNQTQPEIRAQIQAQSSQLSNSLQSINADNEWTAQILVNQAVDLSQHLGSVIERLQREVDRLTMQDEARNIVQQIVGGLSAIRAALDQASVNAQGQAQIDQLKGKLSANLNSASAQLVRLVDLAQPSNQSNQDGEDLNGLVRNLLAGALSVGRNLQVQLRIIAQSN